jgi:hypothetical protein
MGVDIYFPLLHRMTACFKFSVLAGSIATLALSANRPQTNTLVITRNWTTAGKKRSKSPRQPTTGSNSILGLLQLALYTHDFLLVFPQFGHSCSCKSPPVESVPTRSGILRKILLVYLAVLGSQTVHLRERFSAGHWL